MLEQVTGRGEPPGLLLFAAATHSIVFDLALLGGK